MRHFLVVLTTLLAFHAPHVIAEDTGLVDIDDTTAADLIGLMAGVDSQEIEITAEVDASVDETNPSFLAQLEAAISAELPGIINNALEENTPSDELPEIVITGVELVEVSVVVDSDNGRRLNQRRLRRKSVKARAKYGSCNGCGGSKYKNWSSGRMRKLQTTVTLDDILLKSFEKFAMNNPLLKGVVDVTAQDLLPDVIAEIALVNADIQMSFVDILKAHVDVKRAAASDVLTKMKKTREEKKQLRAERSNLRQQKKQLREDRNNGSDVDDDLAALEAEIAQIDKDMADLSDAIDKQKSAVQAMRALNSGLYEALKIAREAYRTAKKEARAARKNAKGMSVADSAIVKSAKAAAIMSNDQVAATQV